MLPLLFIGGAVTGAAGLLAAALYDQHKTEVQYSPLLKTPELLDSEDVTRELNAYFFKAQDIVSKCNKIALEGGNLIFTPIPLPDDGFFQSAVNMLGGKMTSVSRGWKKNELLDLKKECQKLYGRYRGVFLRANELVRDNGSTSVNLDAISFTNSDFSIKNSLANEEWDNDFERLASNIRDFMDTSCNIAEQLIGMLEQKELDSTIDSNVNNN